MQELSWHIHTTSVVGKTQQCLFYLRKLRRENLPQKLLINFYRCAIESVLAYCVPVWYTSFTKAEQVAVQRVIRTVEKSFGRCCQTFTPSPPPAPCSAHVGSSETYHILHTTCFHCYNQGKNTDTSEPGLQEWLTVSFHQPKDFSITPQCRD